MSEQVEGQLTLFQGDSPASRSPLPGSSEARKMTVSSGQKWLELSKNSGPLGLLEKMLLESSSWHSTMCYLTWKPKGTPRGRFLYQLAVSVLRIKDIEPQFWATPNTMDHLPQRSPEALQKQAAGARKGRKRPANLREQVNPETCRMWPTPRSRESGDYQYSNGNHDKPVLTLSGAVKMWPTPKARQRGDCPAERKRRSPDLESAVKMYAIPQARDFRTGQGSRWNDPKRSRNLNDQVAAMLPTPTTPRPHDTENTVGKYIPSQNQKDLTSAVAQNGGQLNPTWVEWLMGFPAGWTDLSV